MTNTKAHTGHAGNSGIQNHSIGDDHPVRTYCVGSHRNRVACAYGIELRTDDDYNGHRDNVELLQLADRITDAVIAAGKDCEGHSEWLTRDDSPDGGYVASLHGWEWSYDRKDCTHSAVFADVVGKLQWLAGTGWIGEGDSPDHDVCIGSWYDHGRIVLDVSLHYDDLDECLDRAYAEGQEAYYDCKAGACRNVDRAYRNRTEYRDRKDAADAAVNSELNVSDYFVYRVSGSCSARYIGSPDYVTLIVCAASAGHAAYIAKSDLGDSEGGYGHIEWNTPERIDGYDVRSKSAGVIYRDERSD